jgi:hypothetical protein
MYLNGLSGVGYDYATAPGGIGLTQYYLNIANWIKSNQPNSTQLRDAMNEWGVTPEDVAIAYERHIQAGVITAQDVSDATGIPLSGSSGSSQPSTSGLYIPPDIESKSVTEKVNLYRYLRDEGYSDGDIRAAVEAVVGPQPDDAWEYLQSKAGYASAQIAADMEAEAAAQAREDAAAQAAADAAAQAAAEAAAQAAAQAEASRIAAARAAAEAAARDAAAAAAAARAASDAAARAAAARAAETAAAAREAAAAAAREAAAREAAAKAARETAAAAANNAAVTTANASATAGTPTGGAGLLLAAAAAYFLLG